MGGSLKEAPPLPVFLSSLPPPGTPQVCLPLRVRQFPPPPPGGAFLQSLQGRFPATLPSSWGASSSTSGWERWALESLLTALLLPLPEAHFLYQEKCECLFLNGTQQVRFLFRWFYDRQEFVRFDSDLGKHVAVTEFGKVDADKWNRNEQWLQYLKAAVNSFCRLAYEMGSYEAPKEERGIGRRSESWGWLFFPGGERPGPPFPFLAFTGDSPPWGRLPRVSHHPLFRTHFLYQEKGECHFLNGTQQVRLLLRSFYNRQEIDYFDSDLGKYVAVTPLGQPDVDKWNRDEVYLQYWKAQVDSVCRHNYRLYSYKAAKREERLIGRRGESWGRDFSSQGGGGRTPLSFPSSGFSWMKV
ncbi:putative MHC class II antigen protein [Naja naja]|nr:putative MHC class II antigen protein [Naja naja]